MAYIKYEIDLKQLKTLSIGQELWVTVSSDKIYLPVAKKQFFESYADCTFGVVEIRKKEIFICVTKF